KEPHRVRMETSIRSHSGSGPEHADGASPNRCESKDTFGSSLVLPSACGCAEAAASHFVVVPIPNPLSRGGECLKVIWICDVIRASHTKVAQDAKYQSPFEVRSADRRSFED